LSDIGDVWIYTTTLFLTLASFGQEWVQISLMSKFIQDKIAEKVRKVQIGKHVGGQYIDLGQISDDE
jgi:hypothetical protein